MTRPRIPVVIVVNDLVLVRARHTGGIRVGLAWVQITPTGAGLGLRTSTAGTAIVLTTPGNPRADELVARVVRITSHLEICRLPTSVAARSIVGHVGSLARPILAAEQEFPLTVHHEQTLIDGNGLTVCLVTSVGTLATSSILPFARG